MASAEEIGLRLELTDQGLVWETMPGLRHQELAVRIYGAIQPATDETKCECYRALDVYVRLTRRLVKRPDISIFCQRPIEEEGFVNAIPEAVIEITSPDSEGKDLVSSPPLYLSSGIKDVVVLHDARNEVHHWTAAASRVVPSPTTLALQCGCLVTI